MMMQHAHQSMIYSLAKLRSSSYVCWVHIRTHAELKLWRRELRQTNINRVSVVGSLEHPRLFFFPLLFEKCAVQMVSLRENLRNQINGAKLNSGVNKSACFPRRGAPSLAACQSREHGQERRR
jgi:hypothetical protein